MYGRRYKPIGTAGMAGKHLVFQAVDVNGLANVFEPERRFIIPKGSGCTHQVKVPPVTAVGNVGRVVKYAAHTGIVTGADARKILGASQNGTGEIKAKDE